MAPEHSSPLMTRKDKYPEEGARGYKQWPPSTRVPRGPKEGSSGRERESSGLRTAAPEHSVPRGSEQSIPGESARGREQWPPSTRFPRTKRGRSWERVLGEVNSDLRALGSPTAQEVFHQWPPQGSSDEVSASQRPEAAFKSAHGLSPPTAPATLGVSSCHILAEGRGDIKCTGPIPCHPARLGITS